MLSGDRFGWMLTISAASSAKSAILLTLAAGRSPALGNVWRITAKKSDFYMDNIGPTGGAMHISCHGPQQGFPSHRFHIRADRRAVKQAGHFVEHSVPRKGQEFKGNPVSEDAFQVARLRWTWHLQRDRYRRVAVLGDVPEPGQGVSAMAQRTILRPNNAWDVDLFVSFGEPYWPIQVAKSQGNPLLGPLRNADGHWLTGMSWVRKLSHDPTPAGVAPRLPKPQERPTRISCGGLGPTGTAGPYWFVETVTAREVLETWPAEAPGIS